MSCLYFQVREVPVTATVGDKVVKLNAYKALLRGDNDHPLAIVGKDYKVVQNKELFSSITEDVLDGLGSPNCKIEDQISHNGQFCYRSIASNDLTVSSTQGSKSDLHFQVIIQNSFGKTAIKLLVGAIDFFCTNGIVTGTYSRSYWRHSKNLRVQDIKSPVKEAVNEFVGYGATWYEWQKKQLKPEQADQCLKMLGLSNKLREKMLEQFAHEVQMRGSTVWALYSAMTYYASHDSQTFPVRRTKVDHGVTTLAKRADKVRRWVKSESFSKLVA